ncbi:uncharacterized protein LOC131530221 [Onychostoma macrolepis]|uniref:uncharacterized protein LOC131530221 n=1 Tax=Onychostoma macrolepis TaxID=369639 RepID=UPI00272D8F8A|nr:uncharacterized protein LOC131530221 [Onychostoma macrolepis]
MTRTDIRRRNMKTSWFLLFVMSCVFGDTGAVETKSVKKEDSVTLNSNVTKGPNDTMLWYFNNTRIALINGEARKSCVYDGEGGIFRGRLEVDYDTGSLNITNITTDHAGLYEAELFRRDNSGTSVPLNRTSKCNSTSITLKNNNDHTIKTINITVSGSGLSPAAVAGIVVGGVVVVLLVAAAVGVGVKIYRCRSSRNEVY